MRELKFRGWDKLHNYMWSMDELLEPRDYETAGVLDALLDKYTDSFSVNKSHVGIELFCDDDSIEYDKEDFILMQYTGLKDKNLIDIYEGDTLTFHDETGTVEWIDSMGSWKFGMADGRWRSLVDGGAPFEVIGNIYENPELLKNR